MVVQIQHQTMESKQMRHRKVVQMTTAVDALMLDDAEAAEATIPEAMMTEDKRLAIMEVTVVATVAAATVVVTLMVVQPRHRGTVKTTKDPAVDMAVHRLPTADTHLIQGPRQNLTSLIGSTKIADAAHQGLTTSRRAPCQLNLNKILLQKCVR